MKPSRTNPRFLSQSPQLSLVILFCILLSSCSTTRNVKSGIDEVFETSEAFHQGFSGLMVYDPGSKKVLYERNSEKYFTPASNTKLLTFYTGLKFLGDSVPALKYAIYNDSLVFKGTGDPSFLHEEFPYSQVLHFLKNRDEQLFYAAPSFQEKHFGPGWSWGDYNWSYSVERGDFPVYGNYVDFKLLSSDSLPKIYPKYFQDKIVVKGDFEGGRSGVTRALSENIFEIAHLRGNPEREQEVPFKYSPQLVTELLSDTLGTKITLLEKIPEDFNSFKTLYSIPTDSLYKRMLQVSDNFIAEQILLLSAGEIADTLKTSIAIDAMRTEYLSDLPDEPQWVDGSGLSRYNLITPRSMVKILEKIQQEVPTSRLFNLLAAGGESGTIENWYKAEEPYIYAKTGTLMNNHSLSGYLKTRTGKILIFSFMNSNYTVPSSSIKKEMEIILKEIHLKL
ncbi:D-alanyl-D-alanine carboxypeptidase/D-alanyl-D-alanine-endopeptidase [Salinimicrobium sp. GXAS 041]|uniref:D-alanyl-D-alanine carboxypeptidase/D-alanyl-D-alanine-endopeptidase n=1 Tax=Salinimicrobium sp. GXAS 041 TaxID=3400806 RepID=UPI003C741DD1